MAVAGFFTALVSPAYFSQDYPTLGRIPPPPRRFSTEVSLEVADVRFFLQVQCLHVTQPTVSKHYYQNKLEIQIQLRDIQRRDYKTDVM